MINQLPLIGINGDYVRSKNDDAKPGNIRDRIQLFVPYSQAIIEAGGLPILIPPTNDFQLLSAYLDMVDGVLFTGGADYHPSSYGEESHPRTVPCESIRAQSDAMLMRQILDRPLPAMGICLGAQLLNISLGGKLIQHLTTNIRHQAISAYEDDYHEVEILENSLLASILAPGKHRVNSAHHQATHQNHLGKGLKVTALASDGTIEALELAEGGDRFFLFLQWHPERIKDLDHRQKIFSAFIQACQNHEKRPSGGLDARF